MLQRVLYRANRRGFTSHCHDLDTLAESAQHDLFRHSCHSAHCLNHLYAAKLKPLGAMRLRACGVAMTLNYLLLNMNLINETLLSVHYFSTYNCV